MSDFVADQEKAMKRIKEPRKNGPHTIKLMKCKPKFKRGKCFAMGIVASRNSGKSYLIRHLIRDYLRDQYDIFLVISDSYDTKTDLEPVIPGAIFLTDMNYELINKLSEDNVKREKKGLEPLRMLIIYDDKIGNDVKYDGQLLQLFTRGRHMNLSIIFSSQSKKFCETTWINNFDYLILLKSNSAQQRQQIIENILPGTYKVEESKDEKRILKKILEEYCSKQGDALIIDNSAQSSDNLFWYRAP